MREIENLEQTLTPLRRRHHYRKEERGVEIEIPGAEFADELFSGGRTRERQTRKEKRENNYE